MIEGRRQVGGATRRALAALLVPLLGLLAFAATPSTGEASAAPTPKRVLKRSIAKPPVIRGIKLRAIPKRRVVARVVVRFPRVTAARGRETGLVKLKVWKSKRANRLFVERRARRTIGKRRVVSYRFVLRGRAARALRRDGVRRHGVRRRKGRPRPVRRITVTAVHGRNLDRDSSLDHLHSISASGGELRGSGPSVGGASGKVTLINGSPRTIVTSAGPAICMYDDGDHGSNVSGLNGQQLTTGQSFTEQVQADDHLFPIPDLVGTHLGIGQTTAGPASLYNSEARLFGFLMNVQYAAENGPEQPDPHLKADLPRYSDLITDGLPDRATACGAPQVRNNFVVGADDPTGLHSAALWSYGIKGTNLQASLGDSGLTQELGGSATNPRITFVAEGNPNQPGQPCAESPAVWVSCVYPPGSASSLTSLVDAAWPGSHDSGTIMLNDERSALFTDAPRRCNPYSKFESAAPTVVYNLAVSQRLNLREQLDAGMRFIDLRAGYDDKTNKWRVTHTLFAASELGQDLATIASWAAAHPNEPVILSIGAVCDAGSGSHLEEFEQAFLEALPNDPWGISLNDVTAQLNELPGVSAPNVGRLSIQELRTSENDGNVLVLLDPHNQYDASFLNGYSLYETQSGAPPFTNRTSVPINSYWPNEQAPFDCAGSPDSNASVQDYPYTQKPPLSDYGALPPLTETPFMVSQALYTIHSGTADIENFVVNAAAGNCPRSLLDWSMGLRTASPTVIDMLGTWGQNTNVVIADDVGSITGNGMTYLERIIALNQAKVQAAGN